MSFQVLSSVTPVTLADRVANLEAALSAGQVPGLIGVHNYAAYNVPATLTSGTDTTGIANQIWISEMSIDKNTLITGLSFLIGTVGGTDKAIAILYNAAGAILATSAVAGVVVGTLATFQRLPLITPYQAAP